MRRFCTSVAIAALASCMAAASSQASTNPAVTVSGSAGTVLSTQLSSNNVWSGMLDQAPGGQQELNALHAPLVRLHIGDDGYPEAMPEINQGQWSFSAIDALVNDVFASGQKPLMNIKFAPDWMWSCYPNSIGVSGKQGAGSVTDLTFNTFAQYMARLVSYYNKGSMTTESGQVIVNPAGTSHAITYWELWNEPDLNIETPCAPSDGLGLTPSQYVTMWNAVTAAMLKVDPTLKFVGPATAGSQFGSSPTTGNQYVDDLMAGAVTKPAAISFHGYGYWDNTVTDQWIFDGDGSGGGCACGGITDIVNGVKAIRSAYPTVPVWLTEVNVNADWGNDSYKRPWSEFAAAWWGAAFAELAPLGVGIIHQYDLVDSPQFGLLDDTTGNPYMAYYVTQLLDQAFPPGSTLLSSSSTDSGILSLAAQKPDGTISVMIVNRKLVSSTAKSSCGTGGVPTTVNVTLPSQPTTVSLQQLDKNNVNCTSNAAIAPSAQSLTPAQNLTVSFPGYGIALLNVSAGSAGTPAPAVSLSPTSVSFGSQLVGSTSAAQSVTLTNSGNAALSISNIAVGGTNASDFAQSNSCPASLAAGASCTISATFTPSATGTRSASIQVTDNATGSPQSIALSGTGAAAAPVVSLAPSSLSFGSQAVGSTSGSQSVTLTNSGNAPLSITSIAVGGTNAGDFTDPNTCPSGPSTLAAGSSCTISATFSPSAPGARSASIQVTDNVGSSPQAVALSGTGFAPGTIALDKTLGQHAVNSSGSTLKLTTSAAAVSGSRVFAFVDWWSGSGTLTSLSGGGLAWSVDAQTKDGTGYHTAIASASAPNGLTASTVLTATFSRKVTTGLIAGASFTGIAPSGPLDAHASNLQGGVANWTGSVVTTNASDLVLGWSGIDKNTTNTATPPNAELFDFGNSTFGEHATAEYQIAGTSGAMTVNGTWASASGATANSTVVVAYMSSSAVGQSLAASAAALLSPTSQVQATEQRPRHRHDKRRRRPFVRDQGTGPRRGGR